MTQGGKDIEMREIMMRSRSSKSPNPRDGEETECSEQDSKQTRIHPPLHSGGGSLNLISDVKGSFPLFSAWLSDPTDSHLLDEADINMEA